MSSFFLMIQLITAVLMPACAIFFSYLTIRHTKLGEPVGELKTCHRCGQTRVGAEGKFHYTQNMGSPRQQMARGQSIITEESILGSETHFVCDPCTHQFLRTEILQQVLVVIPYPVYLFIIVPVFLSNGGSANFLIEIFLLTFVLAGAASAWNLYRSVRMGETSLSEVRDRVVIQTRKKVLGKAYSYFTRVAMQYYEKPSQK